MVEDQAARPPESPRRQPQAESVLAGLSALERGAERGIGPLSPLSVEVWHGQAQPCVSCGELARQGGYRVL